MLYDDDEIDLVVVVDDDDDHADDDNIESMVLPTHLGTMSVDVDDGRWLSPQLPMAMEIDDGSNTVMAMAMTLAILLLDCGTAMTKTMEMERGGEWLG